MLVLLDIIGLTILWYQAIPASDGFSIKKKWSDVNRWSADQNTSRECDQMRLFFNPLAVHILFPSVWQCLDPTADINFSTHSCVCMLIYILIDWLLRHDNLSRVISSLKVRELCLLYIYIYFLVCLFLKSLFTLL